MEYNSLFVDQPLHFEKTAALAHVGESSQDWGPKIVSELHKSAPFITNYTSTLHLERVREEQGYGMGYIDVKNKTDQLLVDEAQGGTNVKHARIPVVIKDFQLQPFDVFLKGQKALPLTEARFTEQMFRPDTFDSSQKPPPDRSMTAALAPPVSSRGVGHGMTTTASVKPKFLMDALMPTLTVTDMDKLANRLKEDLPLAASLMKNAAAKTVLRAVGVNQHIKQANARDTFDVLRESLVPTTVQITKLANGNVKFKVAQPENYDPQETEVPPEQAAEMAGPEVEAMPPESTMTVSPAQQAKEMLLEEPLEPVVTFGEYKVERKNDGKEVMGWVIPRLVKFTLEETEMSLFTNGSEFAVASMIKGKPVGRGANLPSGEPRGYGIWYFERNGRVVGTVPVTLQSTVKNPEGDVTIAGIDEVGQPLSFMVTPGIANISTIGEGQFAIPDHWHFLPLDGRIEVASAEENTGNAELAKEARNLITIRADQHSDVYSLEGMPFVKVASDVKMVSGDQAEFMLVVAGMNPLHAREKLAAAKLHDGRTEFYMRGMTEITPWREKVAGAFQRAGSFVSQVPYLKRDLLKEAAVIEDADTVDKMLSLGFLTPENISVFVEYIPALESAVMKLADLLMFARLGGDSVPEGAARRAMLSMEEVIQGLKGLEK